MIRHFFTILYNLKPKVTNEYKKQFRRYSMFLFIYKIFGYTRKITHKYFTMKSNMFFGGKK